MNRVVWSRKSVEWTTPTEIYAGLNREFQFDFDPCPIDGTIDGLGPLFSVWEGKRVFCNPPYDDIAPWLRRAAEADCAVYLIPSRTDTRWFHEIILPKATEIRFIRGRLKFGGHQNSAPFPSMIVVFNNA
jgi:site-specific DNA-methyltransferase (adenine-specific)